MMPEDDARYQQPMRSLLLQTGTVEAIPDLARHFLVLVPIGDAARDLCDPPHAALDPCSDRVRVRGLTVKQVRPLYPCSDRVRGLTVKQVGCSLGLLSLGYTPLSAHHCVSMYSASLTDSGRFP